MSRQRWNDIESGRKTNIELETLAAIAGALGVPAKDLLTEGKARPPEAGKAAAKRKGNT